MTAVYIIIGLIVVALIVLTIVYLVQRKKAKQRALAEAGEQAAPGGDELSLLIKEADNKLAAAKPAPGARVAAMPVYLLMGDAGSTKTSVMLHSGLDPELLAGQVYQQGNVTSTRAANIWYSRQSVFIEAGGALLAQPAQWRQLAARLRPRGPVAAKGAQAPRAAIVCFDCENFTRQNAADLVANAARNLRARLGEISQALGINLPVYVLFTKMDRLPYFTEYVRNFSNEESTQVLGVTMPMSGVRPQGVYAEEETARLTDSFENLYRSLAGARIEFLPRENDGSKLPAEYEFPREFRKIRQAAVQFLVDLCRPSQLTTGPFLRGFYFTGVRPIIINETAPVQAAPQQAGYGAASGATGIFAVGARPQPQQAPQPAVTGSRKAPQWLFLGHFFASVLLADRSALAASGASTKTSRARRILFAAAAALCLLFSIFFTVSFLKNRALENQVNEAAKSIGSGEAVGGDLASVESLRKLDTLRQGVETLSLYHREGAPLSYRWGLYVGDDLYPQARRVYFARFKQLLFGQTQSGIAQFLGTLPATPGPDYQPVYDALKAYLITTSNPDKSAKMFLTPVMMRSWQNGRTADNDRQQLARQQFDFYAEELKEENPFSKENDSAAIDRSRRYLAQFAGAKRVYAFMLAEASKNNPPINFNRQFPGSAQTVVEAHEVAGPFSKSGWAFMKDAVAHADKYYAGERWVLGDYASAIPNPAQLQQDVKALYYADFLKEWRTYLKSANVVRYADLKDASQKLATLSGNASPLLELFSLASTNTNVDDPTVAGPFQPVQTVVAPGADRLIGGGNQNYMNGLLALQTAVDAAANAAGQAPDQAYGPVAGAAQNATQAARQTAQGFRPDPEGHADSETLRLLLEPIQGVPKPDLGAELKAKGKALCDQMRPLMAKYPFTSNIKAPEASLQDFNSVFKPKDGAIWKFAGDPAVQKFVQRQGSQFVAASGSGVPVSPKLLAMLNRAAAFADVAYAGGVADPHFTFKIKPALSADQDNVKFTINGEAHELSASAAPTQFTWPGNSAGTQVTLKYKDGYSQEFPPYAGLWGIFKFIQDADRHTGNLIQWNVKSGAQNLPLTHGGQPIVLRFEIDAAPPVFTPGYFAGMACVEKVAN
jgi:type VI secretion system protein ImpL